jgi:hypothetical protein
LTRNCADAAILGLETAEKLVFWIVTFPKQSRIAGNARNFPTAASGHEKARRKCPAGDPFFDLARGLAERRNPLGKARNLAGGSVL